MIVNDKTEFDAAMATANNATIIELPGGVIDWELIVNNECNIIGNNTTVDVRGSGIAKALHISAVADISGVELISDEIGVHVDNCAPTLSQVQSSGETAFLFEGKGDGSVSEELSAESSITGFKFKDARGFEVSSAEAISCSIGFDLEGTSNVVGDTLEDPVSNGTDDVLEADRTNRTHHNTFIDCNAHDGGIGLRLVNSDHNTFENSNLYDNSNFGGWQLPNSYTNIFRGEVYGNGNYGFRNTDRDHAMDVRDVWWGDVTGPSGGGKGEGQKISTGLNYDPWLRSGTEPDLIYTATRDWIWSMLGSPQVRVELTEEQVTDSIDMAIDKYLYYMTPEQDWAYSNIGSLDQEVDLSQLIDREGNPVAITKKQIIEVSYQPYADLFSQLTGSGTSFFLTYYMQNSGGTFLADFYIAMSYKEDLEGTLGMTPTYEILSRLKAGVTHDYVRFYPRPTDGMKVGFKYSRTLTEVEVDNTKWIRKYALTWAKEQLGRVRSKYGSVPSPTGETTLDGPQLLSEAAQEREALEQSIISRSEPLSFTTG